MSASREGNANKQKGRKEEEDRKRRKESKRTGTSGNVPGSPGGGLRVLDRKPGILRYDRSLARPLGAEDETQLALLEVCNERRRGKARRSEGKRGETRGASGGQEMGAGSK